jgi:putative transposase
MRRTERLMRQNAMKAKPRRLFPKDEGSAATTRAPNLLDRQLKAGSPNVKWIADFTYIWTVEGWLYVAAIVDLFSRRVAGWSMSVTMTVQLVAGALLMAIWRRGKPQALLHHSDQGSQYTSEPFQALLADHGIACSMNRAGNMWDNAAMGLSLTRRSQGRWVQLYRALLQSPPPSFDDRLCQSHGVRTKGRASLRYCPRNRVQATLPGFGS